MPTKRKYRIQLDSKFLQVDPEESEIRAALEPLIEKFGREKLIAALKRPRGAPRGSGERPDTVALLMMHRRLREGLATSPTEAARQCLHLTESGGELRESTIRRLADKYKKRQGVLAIMWNLVDEAMRPTLQAIRSPGFQDMLQMGQDLGRLVADAARLFEDEVEAKLPISAPEANSEDFPPEAK